MVFLASDLRLTHKIVELKNMVALRLAAGPELDARKTSVYLALDLRLVCKINCSARGSVGFIGESGSNLPCKKIGSARKSDDYLASSLGCFAA